MKITQVESIVLLDKYHCVRVHTDEGLVGIGEVSPMNALVTHVMVEKALAPLIIGASHSGELLARNLMAAAKNPYYIVGLLDDDPNVQNSRVAGIEVPARLITLSMEPFWPGGSAKSSLPTMTRARSFRLAPAVPAISTYICRSTPVCWVRISLIDCALAAVAARQVVMAASVVRMFWGPLKMHPNDPMTERGILLAASEKAPYGFAAV